MTEKNKENLTISQDTITSALLVLVLFIGAINLMLTMNLSNSMNSMPNQMYGMMDEMSEMMATVQVAPNASGANVSNASVNEAQLIEQVAAEVIATGVPAVYGTELSVSFDSVQDSINKLLPYDTGIELQGADLEKYVAVTTSISCEYCCGADAISFSDGKPACGCAHSAAMRGLAKYLIKNHDSEFSEEEILTELQKWKSVFFPKQTIAAAIKLKAQKGEISGSTLAALPDMVGGC